MVNYSNHLCSTPNVVWELRCKQIKAPIREQKIVGGKHSLVRALTQKLKIVDVDRLWDFWYSAMVLKSFIAVLELHVITTEVINPFEVTKLLDLCKTWLTGRRTVDMDVVLGKLGVPLSVSVCWFFLIWLHFFLCVALEQDWWFQ